MDNKLLYCRHCGKKQEAVNIEKKDSKNGKFIIGKCKVCGSTTLAQKLKREDW